MSTYDKRCQLGASRRRLEDAQVLHSQKRWTGAIYLGGYAIECSLKSLICHEEEKNNFKDTKIFQQGLQGASLHNLTTLLSSLTVLQRAITLDRTGKYKDAWNLVSSVWQNDALRYSDKVGDEESSKKFIEAVQTLHRFLLDKQGETS
ncbi:hypothetical protein [Iningainema tapete]|uniref:HEPN domain-containing protein n=1 Tax=Iningainema tapete BLCC-T55 TaxID=2748662 RepID=A0A8J7BZN0_9CYAN|nr:hypothetical protein [Iningainema tapete]MBD2776253.1 hypothetical protein [Iningainema tapete BLCC-T55]